MISFNKVSKSFGAKRVLDNISIELDGAKTHVLLGVSGSGKSTMLRLIVGLLNADQGDVSIDNKNAGSIPHADRAKLFGYVVQNSALFPHLNARQNVELPAKNIGASRDAINQRLDELCKLVQLKSDILTKYPTQMSGGQQQRISLMRALMLDPPYLMMDEPLSALDPIIRGDLQHELQEIFDKLNKTVVFVTHDVDEAAMLGHHVVVLRQGRIAQANTIENILKAPADEFVKKFTEKLRV